MEYKNKHAPWEAGHLVEESEPPWTGHGETHLSPSFADFVLPLLKMSSLVTDLGCFFSFHMDVYSYKFHSEHWKDSTKFGSAVSACLLIISEEEIEPWSSLFCYFWWYNSQWNPSKTNIRKVYDLHWMTHSRLKPSVQSPLSYLSSQIFTWSDWFSPLSLLSKQALGLSSSFTYVDPSSKSICTICPIKTPSSLQDLVQRLPLVKASLITSHQHPLLPLYANTMACLTSCCLNCLCLFCLCLCISLGFSRKHMATERA